MNFKLYLESLNIKTWYHATNEEDAKNIIKNGWTVSISRKTDAGDLGWGIYFWAYPIKGTYGNSILSNKIDMSNIIDVADVNNPKVTFFLNLLFYNSKGGSKTRTIDPDYDTRIDRSAFRDKAIKKLQNKGSSFISAFEKINSYIKPFDSNSREQNSKMIRRNMLKIGVKGILSNNELVVYDPKIIIDSKFYSL